MPVDPPPHDFSSAPEQDSPYASPAVDAGEAKFGVESEAESGAGLAIAALVLPLLAGSVLFFVESFALSLLISKIPTTCTANEEKLLNLIDYPLSASQRNWFATTFGSDRFEESDPRGVGFDARGGFGQWCVTQELAPEYLFGCAEFGTYSPIKMLAGLRAENQAHHWGEPSSARSVDVKANLKELFCPASADWRSTVIEHSLAIVDRAIEGIIRGPSVAV